MRQFQQLREQSTDFKLKLMCMSCP